MTGSFWSVELTSRQDVGCWESVISVATPAVSGSFSDSVWGAQ